MKKKHLAELERINKSIPTALTSQLIRKEQQFLTIKEIATRAQTDDNVSQEDKDKFKAMLDSGYLDREIEVVDASIEQQISDYLDKEIEKAVKLKRLPAKRSKPLTAKALRNERRKQKEVLQASSGSGEGEDHQADPGSGASHSALQDPSRETA